MSYEEASREMDEQSIKNGWKPNPNHSNARYAEHPASEIKREAFHSKHGYSGNHAAKIKDMAQGMPIPEHMKKGR